MADTLQPVEAMLCLLSEHPVTLHSSTGVLDSAPSYQQLYKNTLPPLVIASQLPYRLQTLINASLSLVIRRTQATVILAAAVCPRDMPIPGSGYHNAEAMAGWHAESILGYVKVSTTDNIARVCVGCKFVTDTWVFALGDMPD